MSLKAWRAAIGAAIESNMGLQDYGWDPAVVEAPCVLVRPAPQYIDISGDEATYGDHVVRWVVTVVVRRDNEPATLDEIDDYVEALTLAVAAVIPPDGNRPTVESVEQPGTLTIGEVEYLAFEATVSTLRPNPTP